jgi:hypothetical protein
MSKIFKGQSALRITVKTFTDLDGVISAVIKYRKPDGRMGEFPAVAGEAAKDVISHECRAGELDTSGWWAFWAYVTFADGRTAAGEAEKVFIWQEGR